MNQLTLRYPLFFWLNRPTRLLKLVAPSAWNELSASQMRAVVQLRAGSITENKVLSTFFGIPAFIANRLTPFYKFHLIQLLAFLQYDGASHTFAIKRLRISPRLHLHAPGDKLKGVTFAQFIFADTHWLNYQTTQSPESLALCVAALYSRRNEPFSEAALQSRASVIAKLNPLTLQAIALNYTLVRLWLANAYYLVFQQSQQHNESENQPKGNTSPWIKVFDAIVGDNITAQQEYADLPVNNVLRFMQNRIKNNIKSK